MGRFAEQINTSLSNSYYSKVPAESPKCPVEESMGKKGSACSACLQ